MEKATIHIPQVIHGALKQCAAAEGIPIQVLVEMALVDYLQATYGRRRETKAAIELLRAKLSAAQREKGGRP